MTPLLLTALLLTQAPDDSGATLELDLDYETAYATRPGELAAERGETASGVGVVWLAMSGWRFGLASRIGAIANDPFGSAVGTANPFVADVFGLAEYRWWISRFGFGPQLGAGAEIFSGARGHTGAIFELGLEGTFRFNETWSVHLRFAFSPTAGLETVDGPQAYWRFVGGVEWSSPI